MLKDHPHTVTDKYDKIWSIGLRESDPKAQDLSKEPQLEL